MEELELKKMRAELLAGNNQCLKVVFEKHGTYCVRLLQKNTGCPKADAEDILMDAVLNFRQKIITNKIQYLTNTRNYLFTTCYNMWLVKHAKEKVKHARIHDVVSELYSEHTDTTDPESMRVISTTALASLGEKCQQLITLFYLEELPMKEVADRLGLANAEVAKSTKSRCFKKLMEEATRLLNLQNFSDVR